MQIMKKKVYLFRHGQTDWNLEGRCQGHKDIPLNETGKRQAQALVEVFKKIDVEAIFSSDLSRARETARVVSESKGLPLFLSENLREANLGEAEGMLVKDIIFKFGEETWNGFRFQKGDHLNSGFPGGETRGEGLSRIRNFLFEVLNRTSYQNIILSIHGGIMRSLVHSFMDDEETPIDIPNCVAYCLEMNQDLTEVKLTGPLGESGKTSENNF